MYLDMHGKRPSFLESVLKLIGHTLGGAVLFVTLAGLSWSLGWAVAQLHKIHPFSDTILRLLHAAETGLLYLDILLTGIVLVMGAYRFLRELSGIKE